MRLCPVRDPGFLVADGGFETEPEPADGHVGGTSAANQAFNAAEGVLGYRLSSVISARGDMKSTGFRSPLMQVAHGAP